MATDIRTTAGSTLHLSATLPTAHTVEGFEATTGEAPNQVPTIAWTKVSRITSFGDVEQSYTEVPFNDVETRETIILKGTKSNGKLPLELARIDKGNDVGQTLIKTALLSDNDYSIKITLTDGSIYYCVGKVMSNNLKLGDVNAVTGFAASIALNGKLIEKLPTT